MYTTPFSTTYDCNSMLRHHCNRTRNIDSASACIPIPASADSLPFPNKANVPVVSGQGYNPTGRWHESSHWVLPAVVKETHLPATPSPLLSSTNLPSPTKPEILHPNDILPTNAERYYRSIAAVNIERHLSEKKKHSLHFPPLPEVHSRSAWHLAVQDKPTIPTPYPQAKPMHPY